MGNLKKLIVLVVVCMSGFSLSQAQYYQLANQLGELLSPALSGSFRYKGFADVAYMPGIGSNYETADILEVTTTQGFQYASWFYLGVGAGVNIAFAESGGYEGVLIPEKTTDVGVMIPLYTDLRFNIGSREKTSMFIDLRIGASFLVSDYYFRIGNGYVTSDECFYLKPSIGVRFPVNKNNPKQAINLSANYQLMTPGWSYYNDSLTLHNLGATIGFEW